MNNVVDDYYAQALFDFQTNELNELNFRTGDILEVLNQIDNEWLGGRLIFSGEETDAYNHDGDTVVGIFPSSFVQKIDLNKDDVYFLALYDFSTNEKGDLEFLKHDIIIGLKEIDGEWWSGCLLTNNLKKGIFPLTHVKRIDLNNNFNKLKRNTSSSSSASSVSKYTQAKVIQPFHDNLEADDASYELEFLNLKIGDYVLVTDTRDPYWYKGENIEGKTGYFPRDCVELLLDEKCKTTSISSRKSSYITATDDLNFLDNYVSNLFQFSLSPVEDNDESCDDVKIEESLPNKENSIKTTDNFASEDEETKTLTLEENENREATTNEELNEISIHSQNSLSDEAFQTLTWKYNDQQEFETENNEKWKGSVNKDELEEKIENKKENVIVPPPLPPKPSFLRNRHQNSVKIAESNTENKLSSISNDVDATQVDKENRKACQRRFAIDELISTEKKYNEEMSIIYSCFANHSDTIVRPEAFSISLLFSNMNEILQVSSQLLSYLEVEVAKSNEDDVRIGRCLLKCANDMQQYYAIYIRDYATKHDLIKKYEKNKEINEYIKGRREEVKHVFKNPDLYSLLIKPVQRIPKHKLLIDSLIKKTSPTHGDFLDLKEASVVFDQVLLFINEYQRRKDLILKYKNKEDNRNLLQKITMNTIRKKSSRLNMRLSTVLGLYDQTIDLRFNHEEDRFRNIEREIKIFIKESNHMLTHFKESLDCTLKILENCLEIYKDDEKQIDVIFSYGTVFTKFLSHRFDHFLNIIFDKIWNPLTELVSTFDMPNKLIEKRFNKLLDYDSVRTDSEKNKLNDKTKELNAQVDETKRNYEAMNVQLLEELPILTNTSVSLLQICMNTFTALFHQMINSLNDDLKAIEISLDLPQANSVPMEAMKNYLKQIQFETSNFTVYNIPNEVSVTSKYIQTEEHRLSLRSKYGDDKVYQVTHDNKENKVLVQIEVKAGDIVGVIKNCDPSGDCSVWFCDNGDSKGFVPSGILKMLSKKPTDEIEYFIALYDFNATRNNMLTIQKDQILRVIIKHDTKGDSQWWLVENHNKQSGYVPSNYIAFYKKV